MGFAKWMDLAIVTINDLERIAAYEISKQNAKSFAKMAIVRKVIVFAIKDEEDQNVIN